jgi:MerR family transcriptional regulator/heat shock protein HspR
MRLQRIQELTTDGVSLAGVKRIIELEEQLRATHAEIDALQREIERQRGEARQAVQDVHRQYRRDLIPLSKAIIRFPGRS